MNLCELCVTLLPLLRRRHHTAYGVPENVSHASILPESSPVLNHCIRCAEVPCVNFSGITVPAVIFWM